MTSFVTEEPKTTKQKILEAGANLLQSKDPIKSFKQHLVSVAFVNGEPTKQFILHHYLNSFNDEFGHALLYDGDQADAKLVGILYIISERVFMSLPEEEKKFWHSLHFMVKNGLIIAPSLPSVAEKPLMLHLASCYGKSFLFWQTQHTPLPYGIPQLLMGFTAEGQVNDLLVNDMLAAADLRMSDILRKREKIPTTVIHPGADSWQTGEIYQLRLERVGEGMGSSMTGQSGIGGGQQTYPTAGMMPPTGTMGGMGAIPGMGATMPESYGSAQSQPSYGMPMQGTGYPPSAQGISSQLQTQAQGGSVESSDISQLGVQGSTYAQTSSRLSTPDEIIVQKREIPPPGPFNCISHIHFHYCSK
jgi:hypothetical protein